MMEPGFYNMDCMEALKEYPDKYFDLAVCDPPYGINITGRHKVKDGAVMVGGGVDRSAGCSVTGKCGSGRPPIGGG